MEPGRGSWLKPAEEQRLRVHGMPPIDEWQQSLLQVRSHRLSAARWISKARGIGGVLGVEQSRLGGRLGMEGRECGILDLGSNAHKVATRSCETFYVVMTRGNIFLDYW